MPTGGVAGLTSFGFGPAQGRETIKTCATTHLLEVRCGLGREGCEGEDALDPPGDGAGATGCLIGL